MTPLTTFGSLALLASTVVAQNPLDHSHIATSTVIKTAYQTITLGQAPSQTVSQASSQTLLQPSKVIVTRYVTVANVNPTQAPISAVSAPWNSSFAQANVNSNNTVSELKLFNSTAHTPVATSSSVTAGGDTSVNSISLTFETENALTSNEALMSVENIAKKVAVKTIYIESTKSASSATTSIAPSIALSEVSAFSTAVSSTDSPVASSATTNSAVSSSSEVSSSPVSTAASSDIASSTVASFVATTLVSSIRTSTSASSTKTTSTTAVAATGISSVMLASHNKYRTLHKASDLTWSTELASYAENYLSSGALCNGLVHSGGEYGENLAAGMSITGTVDAWYGEVKDYDFNNPGFSSGTGHFTQVVWVESSELGCAEYKCPSGSPYGNVVSCNYKVPGNMAGGYQTNVLPQ
ncbi:PR-1-like protein [Nadsonia fulvescens var. elongata DSM 6958]|uniref:PR-1-like protein n=1 Tax=Nadsonia fulvescens var. elongata DSM 6958 TaxID=857566 RepID=A0A1E3PMY7_9ASCO|nr:PR-1-like protein [Nadsonia fulvescens var. elongata DSM 6958]